MCVQAAVDRVLQPLPPDANSDAQQQHLKLLVEVYKRTHTLAEQLQVSFSPLFLVGILLHCCPDCD